MNDPVRRSLLKYGLGVIIIIAIKATIAYTVWAS